jgi:hypothetical protein
VWFARSEQAIFRGARSCGITGRRASITLQQRLGGNASQSDSAIA